MVIGNVAYNIVIGMAGNDWYAVENILILICK
jgi:hypothetical protein